jgi:Fur family peroxide stress response transcriptional regulator
MAQTVERLRQAGLKATGPRVTLLAALEQDRSHPTAEQLYESLRPHYPSLSLSTVYETLDAFLRTGLCRRVSATGAPLRVDGTPQDHDHALCRVCGSIFDIDQQLLPRPIPPTHLPQDLTVTGLRVEYDVICARCAAIAQNGAMTQAPAQRFGTARSTSDAKKLQRN